MDFLSILVNSTIEGWRREADASGMLQFWLTDHPFKYPILMMITFLLSHWFKSSKLLEINDRPFLLIFDGFFFGAQGIGLLIVYFGTRSGRDMFQHHSDIMRMMHESSSEFIRAAVVRHIIIIFLFLLLLDFAISILRATSNSIKRTSSTQLLPQSCWMLILFICLSMESSGVTLFPLAAHMFHRFVFYADSLLSLAVEKDRHGSGYSIKNSMGVEEITSVSWITNDVLEILIHTLIVWHQSYFLLHRCMQSLHEPKSNMFPLFLVASYSSLRSCFLLWNIFRSTAYRTDEDYSRRGTPAAKDEGQQRQ